MSTYNIDFSDPLRSGFQIAPGGFNGPGGDLSATALRLYGRGALEWGEAVNEDLVRLAENFAGATPPLTPVGGQLWIRQKLYILSTNVALPSPGAGATLPAANGTFFRYKFAVDPYGTVISGGDTWYSDDGSANAFAVNVFNGTISAYGNGATIGEYVYAMTDQKLYRWDTAYRQAVPAWLERSFTTIAAADPNTPKLYPDQALVVYDQFNDEWDIVQIMTVSTDAPGEPQPGQMWYDPINNVLYVWNGSSWSAIVLAGSPVSGNIDMGGTYTITNLPIVVPGTNDAIGIDQADGRYVNVTGDAMTGALELSAGSVGVPSLSFDGDENTGMYSPAADTIAFSTGGSDRLTIGTVGLTSTLPLDMSSQKITGLAAGTNPSDAVTYSQLTSFASPAPGSTGFANIYNSLVATNVAGDIAVVGGIIYIASAPNVWRQVYPAVYS